MRRRVASDTGGLAVEYVAIVMVATLAVGVVAAGLSASRESVSARAEEWLCEVSWDESCAPGAVSASGSSESAPDSRPDPALPPRLDPRPVADPGSLPGTVSGPGIEPGEGSGVEPGAGSGAGSERGQARLDEWDAWRLELDERASELAERTRALAADGAGGATGAEVMGPGAGPVYEQWLLAAREDQLAVREQELAAREDSIGGWGRRLRVGGPRAELLQRERELVASERQLLDLERYLVDGPPASVGVTWSDVIDPGAGDVGAGHGPGGGVSGRVGADWFRSPLVVETVVGLAAEAGVDLSGLTAAELAEVAAVLDSLGVDVVAIGLESRGFVPTGQPATGSGGRLSAEDWLAVLVESGVVSVDAVEAGLDAPALQVGGGVGGEIGPDPSTQAPPSGTEVSGQGVPAEQPADGLSTWGERVAQGVGVTDPVLFMNALLVQGVITPDQWQVFTEDPAFLAGLGEALASGGRVQLDSPGQRELDRLLAQTTEQIRGVLAQPVDLRAGPSGAQLLALHLLSGGNDFALLELVTNWLFVRHPDLELRYDADDDVYLWWHGGHEVSTPFLAELIRELDAGDVENRIRNAVGDVRRDDENFCRGVGGDEYGDCGGKGGDDEWRGVYSLRPTFEHLNADRRADLGVQGGFRINQVAAVLGLDERRGAYVIPGEPRLGFDIDDNYAHGSAPAFDAEITDLLRIQDPELLTGSDYFLVHDRGEVIGGLGDDFVLQVGGVSTIEGGGGRDQVVLADGATATVVDSQGDLQVQAVSLLTGDGSPVTLTLTDDGNSRRGDLDVSLLTDTLLDGTFTGPGTRTVTVGAEATVTVAESLTSLDDEARETIAVLGSLVGPGSVDLGGGSDQLVTDVGSMLALAGVDLGDGDDLVDLAGQVVGTEIDLGGDNDVVLIRDSSTGEWTLTDPAGAWVWAGSSEIHENDQVFLVGEGFALADPDDPSAGLVRRDADGAVVARIDLGDDSENIEHLVVVDADGRVIDRLQSIAPEVREQSAWLGFLATALKIGGLVSGQLYLTAAGAVLDTIHTIDNGGDILTTVLSNATSTVAGTDAAQDAGLAWIGALGDAAVATATGDLTDAFLAAAAAAGGIAGIGDLTTAATTAQATLAFHDALAADDPLGALRSLLTAGATATGTTTDPLYVQVRAALDLTDAALTGDPDAIALATTRLGLATGLIPTPGATASSDPDDLVLPTGVGTDDLAGTGSASSGGPGDDSLAPPPGEVVLTPSATGDLVFAWELDDGGQYQPVAVFDGATGFPLDASGQPVADPTLLAQDVLSGPGLSNAAGLVTGDLQLVGQRIGQWLRENWNETLTEINPVWLVDPGFSAGFSESTPGYDYSEAYVPITTRDAVKGAVETLATAAPWGPATWWTNAIQVADTTWDYTEGVVNFTTTGDPTQVIATLALDRAPQAINWTTRELRFSLDPDFVSYRTGGGPAMVPGFRADGTFPRSPFEGSGYRVRTQVGDTCGVYAACAVADFYGLDFNLQGWSARYPDGAFPSDQVLMLRHTGLDATVVEDIPLEDFLGHVAENGPSIATVQTRLIDPEYGTYGLHAVVVDGVGELFGVPVVLVRNPAGTRYYQTLDSFEQQFYGEGTLVFPPRAPRE